MILHKFMLEFHGHIREKIDLREDIKRYIGHIDVNLIEDGMLCSKLAGMYYIPAGGARSLLSIVDMVEDKLVDQYMETDELVTEAMNDGSLLKYIVRLVPRVNTGYDIGVFKESESKKEGNELEKKGNS